jgi:fucose 4-O-acetylase-like acetyltransferase
MPLFMFISGYIATRTKSFDLRFIEKKFKSLVVPFILWYLISYFIQRYYLSISIKKYVIMCIQSPEYGLWFLWVLFLNFILLFIFIKLQKVFKNFAIVPVFVFINILPINILGISLVRWYFIFFIAGYFVSNYSSLIIKHKIKLEVIAFVLYPVLLVFWHRAQNPTFIPFLNSLPFKITTIEMTVILNLYWLMVPALGIIIVVSIVNYIKRFKIYNLFCWLGLYTIDIYILQFYFLKKHSHFPFNIIITFLIVMIFSLIISYILRSFKITRKYLLGQSK